MSRKTPLSRNAEPWGAASAWDTEPDTATAEGAKTTGWKRWEAAGTVPGELSREKTAVGDASEGPRRKGRSGLSDGAPLRLRDDKNPDVPFRILLTFFL